jgi:hypothetical protein
LIWEWLICVAVCPASSGTLSPPFVEHKSERYVYYVICEQFSCGCIK